jgi:hypothetical protein
MAMSNIYNQGYGQAMGLAGQQVANLGSMGQQMAALGAGAQGSVLQGAQAQMAAGAQQQATQQAGLQAAYEQWMQKQAYPFQQAQFFANIAQGLGAGAGGTSSTTAPSPSPWSQAAGAIGAIGSIFSDKRLKENVQAVGKLNDGQTIYRYNFKGDPKTQIGLLAQEVEETKPGAVTQVKGLKMVDYKDATEDAANSMGGVVSPGMDRQGLAAGGVSFYPYEQAQSYIPEGKIGGRGDTIGSRAPSPSEEKGLGGGWGDIKPLTQSQASGIRGLAADVGIDLPRTKAAREYDEANPPDYFGRDALLSATGRLSPMQYASGGVAGRKHYQDGGMEDVPTEEEGLAAVPEPVEVIETPTGVAPIEEGGEGLAAATVPESADGFVVEGQKPGLGFNLGKIFANEENPSVIERVMGRRLSPEARSAVMNASFALMAGRSPFFFSNLGEAGRVGTQTYYNALEQKQEAENQAAEMAQRQYGDETSRMVAETARDRLIREQEEAVARKQQLEEAIAQLPFEQQAVARLAPDEFFKAQAESILGTTDLPALVEEYRAAKEEGYEGTLEDWKKISGASDSALGLQLVPLTDKDGNFVGYGQASKAGGIYFQGEAIDGVNIRPMDPSLMAQTRAAGSAMGTQMGGAAAEIPGAQIDADAMNATIDLLIGNPNLENAIGYGNILTDYLVSNEVLKIRSELNKLEGGTFLSAYATLKGGGAITEVESAQAKQAIADIQTARRMSDREMFVAALESLRDAFNRGVSKLRARAGQYAPQGGPPTSSSGGEGAGPVYNFNPETNELE